MPRGSDGNAGGAACLFDFFEYAQVRADFATREDNDFAVQALENLRLFPEVQRFKGQVERGPVYAGTVGAVSHDMDKPRGGIPAVPLQKLTHVRRKIARR